MTVTRRDFFKTSALAGVSAFVGGCGQPYEQTGAGETLDTQISDSLLVINEPAEAYATADRIGNASQTELPPPAPKPSRSWSPGDFVLKANVDYLGVALNYDDGPSPYNTDLILRTLESHGVQATFYVIGVNAIAWPDILRRIRDAGHEIGNHSQFHTPYRAFELASQIPTNQNTIRQIADVTPVSNRAPGLTRGQGILDMCAREGMYEVHTTIDSGDWKSPRISASSIISNVLGPLHAGAIPLQHDGGNWRPTPEAQDTIIQEAKKRGYIFKTVTELINSGVPNPGVNYYSSATLEKSELDTSTQTNESCAVGINCQYDPMQEFLRRLDDPTVSAMERSRIVEAVALLEEHKSVE